jgi:hypothetical protein
MNTKNTIKYIHPLCGEIWIDKNCAVIELMKEDKNKADVVIQALFFNCYGRYTLNKPEGDTK